MKREKSSTTPYQTFEDLDVYRVAREFRKAMYAITRRLPDFAKFALADQIRRASVSLTNNIAEGHGRFHFLDQIKFILHSRGSLEELLDDLNVCADEKYLSPEEIESLTSEGWRVHKLINGYIRFLRTRHGTETNRTQETPTSEDEFDVECLDVGADIRFNSSSLQRFNE